ncbi:hypothetical protein H6P81_017635 [Aristolochia fimbriata]|uniref:DUF7895 domain-containing protein n=1 Tax=Aristolochia fimbriata TaxID=158543 RepID=A0AAV7E1T9_ARIFI|nr:hypothetical protein H6P81_017635 [Aristolochia fimbriata]
MDLISATPASCLSADLKSCNLVADKSSHFPFHLRSQKVGRKNSVLISSSLQETAVTIGISAMVVGAAATIFVKTNKTSGTLETSTKVCEDCGGSGVCSVCNGEGFVLKKLSEESAQKARLAAKNAATRYTAGLPKKWTYCSRCSSSRSCSICGGSGRVSL